jgi:antitoxin PrlF
LSEHNPKTEPVKPGSSCRLAGMVSMDGRGQIVLPREIRESFGLKAGDKLAVMACREGDRDCCLFLVKAIDVAAGVRHILEPVAAGILKSGE